MLRLRKALYSDMDILYDWRNEKRTRDNSFHSSFVLYDEHKKWFETMMKSADIVQYIMEEENLPVGQVRLNIHNEMAQISYSIASEYRYKGYGHKIIRLIKDKVLKEHPQIKKLVAKVKFDNIASQKIFEKEDYKMKYYCYEYEIFFQSI